MVEKSRVNSIQRVWEQLASDVQGACPHLSTWFNDTEAFRELRLMARDDGTTLAVAKGYGPDGGPVVCFGVGYGVAAALMAVDATINGGRWKVDPPYQGNSK